MKLLSWNVNGLRAIITKGFNEYVSAASPDVICLQETKLSPDLIEFSLDGYHSYFNYAGRKGYSGTALFSREEPIEVGYGEDDEGRTIIAEYKKFYVITAYAPNSGRGLERKTLWNKWFREKLSDLDSKKPLMISGDLNAALTPLDLWNPEEADGKPGYIKEEREDMRTLLSLGFVDVYRYLYPKGRDYSWWSYFSNDRALDHGMRIDYWLTSARIAPRVNSITIDKAATGSDHAPIILDIAY